MLIRPTLSRNSFTTEATTKASILSREENLAAIVRQTGEGVPSANVLEDAIKIIHPADLEEVRTARLRSAESTFRVHKIYGDGNCLFRAVSYVLWNNEDDHRALRTLVTNHIRSHWREYGAFVAAEWGITSPNVYHDFMITEGVFATELECTVATKLYRMNLSIYREINGTGNVKRVFHNRVDGSYETARLLFTGRSDSGHYDVLFIDS